MNKWAAPWVRLRDLLAHPQALALGGLLLLFFLLLAVAGDLLAPLLAATILAYLLDPMVRYLERKGLHRLWAVVVVFGVFTGLLAATVFALVPLLSRQLIQWLEGLPALIANGQALLLQLSRRYPQLFSTEQVTSMIHGLGADLLTWRQAILAHSLSFGKGLAVALVYLFLVPVLVFFMLKDKQAILQWLGRFVPADNRLIRIVWHEVDQQTGNYLRGTMWRILAMGGLALVGYWLLGIHYVALLATIIGLAVLVPYVGAAIALLPLVAIAYGQWGLTSMFWYALLIFAILQILDGNLLAPLILAGTVDLHPVAIIASILFFGGIWGFWGIFFAIPLATLLNAVLLAWRELQEMVAHEQQHTSQSP